MKANAAVTRGPVTRGPEYRRILEAIDAVASAPDLNGYARIATEVMLDLIPCLSVSYNELNRPAQRAFAIIHPDPGAAWFTKYQPIFEAHMFDNALIELGAAVEFGAAVGDTRPLTWDDVPKGRSIDGTPLDTLFYRPNGIRSQLVMYLPAPPGVTLGFALNRGVEGFDEHDRETLGLLKPHLIHAYRAVQLRSEATALRSALGADGWAVVLVDREGRVLDSSPGARPETAGYGVDLAAGASLAKGPLRPLFDALALYDSTQPAIASEPVRMRRPDGILEAVVVPSAVGPHVVLLRRGSDPRRALEKVGLSARQVDVALALARGGNNRDIAHELGIAVGTVKKHLEVLYSVLGVEHRAAAIARISAML